MEKLIVCGIPRQFLSGSAANTVSIQSHVHPLLTMEGAGGEVEGQEDTAQRGWRAINGSVGQDTGQPDDLNKSCMCTYKPSNPSRPIGIFTHHTSQIPVVCGWIQNVKLRKAS